MFLISQFQLISQGLLLGLGLTMDACAVSMSNGLQEPSMKKKKMILIALTYALFQALMPLIGYFCGNILYNNFSFIENYHIIPILSLVLLLLIGGKMIIEGIKEMKETKNYDIDLALKESKEIDATKKIKRLIVSVILLQGIATSIDALSTGLTFADFNILEAFIEVSLIATVTFILSFIALFIGKKFGDKLGNKAIIFGGIILIVIGIEIFVTGIWF